MPHSLYSQSGWRLMWMVKSLYSRLVPVVALHVIIWSKTNVYVTFVEQVEIRQRHGDSWSASELSVVGKLKVAGEVSFYTINCTFWDLPVEQENNGALFIFHFSSPNRCPRLKRDLESVWVLYKQFDIWNIWAVRWEKGAYGLISNFEKI